MKTSGDSVIHKQDTALTQTNNNDSSIVDAIVNNLWIWCHFTRSVYFLTFGVLTNKQH